MEIEEVKNKVKDIIRDELQKTSCRAFFFGSRISGTASDRSDLDVGIECDAPLPDKLRSIKARCEALPTLYTVDIVDFSTVSDDFKKVAKEHVEDII